MARAEVVIKLRTDGEDKVRRALAGIVRDSGRAQQQAAKAAQAAARQQEAAERNRTRMAVESERNRTKATVAQINARSKAEQTAARIAIATDRNRSREAMQARALEHRTIERQLRDQRRMEEQHRRELVRANRDAQRQIERDNRNAARNSTAAARDEGRRRQLRQRGMMAAGSAAIGVGSAVVDRARQYQSTFRLPSRDEMVQNMMDFDYRMIRLGAQGNLDAQQQDQLRSRIFDAARSSATDPMQIMAGLEVAQNRFSNLDAFTQNAALFAQASNALGTPMEEIIGSVGEMQRQFELSAEDTRNVVGMMTTAAQRGSVEFGDVSSEFATTIGTFARTTGQGGMGAVQQFLGMAEVLGAGGASGGQSAMLAENLLSKFSNADVLTRLRSAGVNTGFDASGNGQFVGLEAVISQLTSSGQFMRSDGTVNTAALQGIFGSDRQANDAIGILMQQAARGNTISAAGGGGAQPGLDLIASTNQALVGSTMGQAKIASIDMQESFSQNGRGLTDNMLGAATLLGQFESEFPAVVEAAGFLKDALLGAGGLFIALRAMGVGGGILGGTSLLGRLGGLFGIGTATGGGYMGLAAGGAGAAGAAGSAGAGGAAAAGGGGIMATLAGLAGPLGLGALAGTGLVGMGSLFYDRAQFMERESGRTDMDRIRTRELSAGAAPNLATGLTWLPSANANGTGEGARSSDSEIARAITQTGRETVTELQATRRAISNIQFPTGPNPGDTRPNGRP